MIGKRYEYDAMAACEKDLWWYKCLHELTLENIKKVADKNAAILDAGCGTGGLLTQLQNDGFTNLSGFDLSTDAINYTIKRGFTEVKLLNILDADKAYAPKRFDVIVSNDILCLLNKGDDKLALKKLLTLLKPGGILMMNLPAGRYFKGTHDHAVSITTRYSTKKIQDLTEGTGVEIKSCYYWPFLLSPLIFSIRLIQRCKLYILPNGKYKSDVSLLNTTLNNIFFKLTKLENQAMKAKPWGSSIFVTLVKRHSF